MSNLSDRVRLLFGWGFWLAGLCLLVWIVAVVMGG